MSHKFSRNVGVLAAVSAVALSLSAQTLKDEFKTFRNNMMGEYNEYRKTVLSNYDSFLEGVWKEFEVFSATSKFTEPKPDTIPVAAPRDPDAVVEDTEIPMEDPFVKPPSPVAERPSLPTLPVAPTSLSSATPITSLPVKLNGHDIDMWDNYVFPYYNMELEIADVDFDLQTQPATDRDYAVAWREMRDSEEASALIAACYEMAKRYNLNDYLTYEAIAAYVSSRYPDYTRGARVALIQYLMANLGYDVRITIDVSNNRPYLLIPFVQEVYRPRQYLIISNSNYFIFDPENPGAQAVGPFSTCVVPDDIALNRFNLIINDLNLPEDTREYDIEYGPLHLSGTYNANIMPVLYKYPNMTMSAYADSEVLPEVRKELVEQVREQLSGMSKIDAVNTLLSFFHHGFDYATDGDFHGFEKPYFIEENLFYPKNDCEDRAIFYTYLLWNALGIECDLLHYNGHESASVHLPGEEVKGYFHEHDGKKYYFSDPTYVNSKTGDCMKTYLRVKPGIDKTYTHD